MEDRSADVDRTMKKPTERFSDRVENYVRYRPTYPAEAIDALIEICGVDRSSTLADIGSGTGILTRQLLDRGLRVIAVEPNGEMRQAAESQLSEYGRFTSVDGCAERSTLPDSSVDLIVAAQAFHWFRYDEARREFARIVRAGGWLALIWNQRTVREPLQQEYEAMLREHAPEYATVCHRNIPEASIERLFVPGSYRVLAFENAQWFDRAGFLGRIQSSSYTPAADAPGYRELVGAAERLFSRHEEDGRVRIAYNTELYLGQV